MTAIAEKRAFFLRNVPVNVGADRDKEIGFPVKHKVKKLVLENGAVSEKYVDTYNRCLEGNVPTANVWEKLLNSIYFKLDDELEGGEDLASQVAALQNSIAGINQTLNPIPRQITSIEETLIAYTSTFVSNFITATTRLMTKVIWLTYPDSDYTWELKNSEGAFSLIQVYGQNNVRTHIITYGPEDEAILFIAKPIDVTGASTIRGNLHVIGNISYTGTLNKI